ncbi:hypothetical protein I6I07_16075 [Achromobacter deleyi]|uniref:Uncharacterized protein n=1 Tax=Achromobacter deleyi TaxID=1353891 RepID=A0A7T4E0E6_9BURK|nr:hypothetical protein [Achromobacter deleyi]QQB32228.1 hypothetical protein I6I07_16075 [Achromobacter deleyi]
MSEKANLKVFAQVGGYMQHIGAEGPDGWIEMQGERPAPDYAAQAGGTWGHKPIVPRAVTRRQGRLALLETGRLDAVEDAIEAIADSTERRAAQIEYEAETWERGNEFLALLWQRLGGTEAQLDDLFILASAK